MLHTNNYLKAEDERSLSHIPFMGDDTDDEFGYELMKTFEDGIHGTKCGCGEFINDRLVYETIRRSLMQHDVGRQQGILYLGYLICNFRCINNDYTNNCKSISK